MFVSLAAFVFGLLFPFLSEYVRPIYLYVFQTHPDATSFGDSCPAGLFSAVLDGGVIPLSFPGIFLKNGFYG